MFIEGLITLHGFQDIRPRRPNLQFYEAALKSCGDGGRWADALQLLQVSWWDVSMFITAFVGGLRPSCFEEMQNVHVFKTAWWEVSNNSNSGGGV